MRRRGGLWWLGLSLATGAVLVVYYAGPGGGNGQSVVFQLVGTGSALALAIGGMRRPAGERRGWMFLSLGILLFSAGDAIWDFYYAWFLDRTPAIPSSADALYLAGYVLLIAGVVLIVPSHRIPLSDLLDVGVLTVSAGGVVWFFWISPQTHAAAGTASRIVSSAYPTMDFLMVVVLVYAAFATKRWPTYLRLLAVGFACMLTADLLYYGSYAGGSWLDTGWLLNYLLLAGAALHPGGTEARRTRLSYTRWRRFALVACAALLLPAAMLADAISGTAITDGYASAGFAIAIVLLVFLRMAMLLREQSVREHERAKLLRRSVEATEEERRRVARDLHDGPIQAMTAIALKLDLLGRRREREQREPLPLLEEIRSDIAAEIVSLRQVMSDLRPQVLDRGLPVALTDCAQTVLKGSGIECSVRVTLNGDHIAQEIESAVYRVTRESLINVRKHSRASNADVLLERVDGGVHLIIRDDGIGFDARTGGAGDTAGHLGLVSMEEGIATLGGTWTVGSATGAGTTVEAVLPFEPA